MRELPLNDKSWIKSNIISYKCNGVWTVSFKHAIELLVPYSDLNINGQYRNTPFKTAKGKKLIFRYERTYGDQELFKYEIKEDSLYEFAKNILKKNEDIEDIDCSEIILKINENHDNIFKYSVSKGELIKEFLSLHMDIDTLSQHDQILLIDYCRDKMDLQDCYENRIKTVFADSSDDVVTFKDITSRLQKDIFDQSKINVTRRQMNDIKMKYLLLKTGYFSGVYKVNTTQFSDTLKKGVFDTVVIRVNMMMNHKANLVFIKENRKKINTILSSILKLNSKTHEYVNYLELYDLLLTRDNILEAKFCFKKGLEELLKEKEKEEN